MQRHLQQAADARRYNLPTVEEIAAIVSGDGSENVRVDCDIIYVYKVVVYIESATFIHYISFFIMCFFLGWHLNIPLQQHNGNAHRSKKVT